MRVLKHLKAAAVGALIFGGAAPPVAWAEDTVAPREIEIVVQNGYHPREVQVRQGEHIRLKFVRREYSGCTREVVFPTLGIRKELPTHEPVVVDLPALQEGPVPFHCGMKMIQGAIVVEAK